MTRRIGTTLRFAVLVALAAPQAVGAAVHAVDDSASRVVGGPVRMHWEAPEGRRWKAVAGTLAVHVRLNVSPWQGRVGRIYMRVPAQPAGRIDVEWTTHGVLSPGALRDGERRLVYAGVIPGPVLEDLQHLRIRADGERLTRAEQLQFLFEIEVESP